MSNQHRMILFPMEILMQHKLSQEDVLRGNDCYGMRETVFEIATRANSHLEKVLIINIVPGILYLFKWSPIRIIILRWFKMQ